MFSKKNFFIVPEDVFRLGRSGDPKLTYLRSPTDVDITEVNGIQVVVANNRGVSVWDETNIRKLPMSGWIWKIPASVVLPSELKLHNDQPGHYVICPTRNMPVDKFKGLLEELGMRATRVWKHEVAK